MVGGHEEDQDHEKQGMEGVKERIIWSGHGVHVGSWRGSNDI